jgi:hypothetical protein
VLIELFICFQLQKLGVSPQRILESRKNIAKETNNPYPFATSKVLSDGRKIWYEFKDAVVNADGTRQANFEKIIQKYIQKIDFDEDEQAVKFYPNGRESSVVINPRNQFGQPIIKAVEDAIRFYQNAA